jgi:class 3 adenylate cyclase
MASLPGGPARAAAIRTFLIADVRGYTRFTALHGDEAASRLATRFADVAAEGVEAWGGELVELRGDEALAVFDSARAALRAAVELQSAFADETAMDPAVDDRHLAVTLQTGDLLFMAIDPAELGDTVRASLTRTSTDTECKTYGIGPCPTLEQLLSGN